MTDDRIEEGRRYLDLISVTPYWPNQSEVRGFIRLFNIINTGHPVRQRAGKGWIWRANRRYAALRALNCGWGLSRSGEESIPLREPVFESRMKVQNYWKALSSEKSGLAGLGKEWGLSLGQMF